MQKLKTGEYELSNEQNWVTVNNVTLRINTLENAVMIDAFRHGQESIVSKTIIFNQEH